MGLISEKKVFTQLKRKNLSCRDKEKLRDMWKFTFSEVWVKIKLEKYNIIIKKTHLYNTTLIWTYFNEANYLVLCFYSLLWKIKNSSHHIGTTQTRSNQLVFDNSEEFYDISIGISRFILNLTPVDIMFQ